MKTTQKAFFTFFILFFTISIDAQSPLGSWKRISMIEENAQGKKTDTHKELIKLMPCTENTIHSFLANGKMSTKTDGCVAGVKKSIEDAAKKSTWLIKGNIIYTTYEGDKSLNTKCKVSFSGNKMIMTYTYTPNDYNPSKMKSIAIIYERV